MHGRPPRNSTFPPLRADRATAIGGIPADRPFPQLLATAFWLAGGTRGNGDNGDNGDRLAEIGRVTDLPETTLVFDYKRAADRTDPAWLDLTPRLTDLAVYEQVIRGADDVIFPPPTGRLTAHAIAHATLATIAGWDSSSRPSSRR